MAARAILFELHFEIIFLENYSKLKLGERKAVDKAIGLLSANPRHPSLNVQKLRMSKVNIPMEGMMYLLGMHQEI
jgi:hypothetical protein